MRPLINPLYQNKSCDLKGVSMPFIPHTHEETASMLSFCGVKNINELFDEIPSHLRNEPLKSMAEGINEFQMSQHMQSLAALDGLRQNYIGAGAYEHYIPKMVWDLTSQSGFLTSYTPYQAEASQGTLQLLWEFQSMIASLMGLPIANASLYEGATALAEAILMTVRLNKKITTPRVLIPNSLNPHYRLVLETLIARQGIELFEVPYEVEKGTIDISVLKSFNKGPFNALVIAQPNFFGVIEPVDQLTDWAESQGIPVIGVVNPIAMALLKPPGQWGQNGAAIACGEAQPLGIPLSGGGPYCGFLACKQAFLRQIPGRLVGRTTDRKGRLGYTLTLQAREQHIRRAKATSNICTNQGLLVTAATIYMSLMGPQGLKSVALRCHHNLMELKRKLNAKFGLSAFQPIFKSDHFHECAFKLPFPASKLLHALGKQGIDAGFELNEYYPEMENGLLICTTETKTNSELDHFCDVLDSLCGGQ